jgi:hypothetical protein
MPALLEANCVGHRELEPTLAHLPHPNPHAGNENGRQDPACERGGLWRLDELLPQVLSALLDTTPRA